MNKLIIFAFAAMASAVAANAKTVVSTDAYRWQNDSIIQGEYKAWAVSPTEIRSTYSARPGYFMPVEKTWTRKNDLSAYPRLTTENKLLQAVYNMGLDEMVNAVEPDTTLRTGKEWAGVWTRDVSYSIILSMAALQTEASKISLLKKVTPEGQIIQDTGSGGAWPVSSDRLVWALAAWEIYKVTGDKKWLETVYPIVKNSVEKDEATIYSPDGLVMGETSFIDWREQSYPKWMQTADIARSEAMNTNFVHAAALGVLSEMAAELGHKTAAKEFAEKSERLAAATDSRFWLDKGYYGMYTYGRDNLIVNPRAETLGESIAVLYDLVPAEKARSIVENNPVTPFGAAIFFPQIADMPNYHNNALWPFVGSYWALANAKQQNEQGTLEAIGAIVRPAALFATNKENFNLDNGDIFTELNSSNMLWSLSGNLALTQQILFGIHFEKDGIRFRPFVPQTLADDRLLENFPYRGGRISVSVSGFGSEIASMTVNGKSFDPAKTVPAKMLKDGAKIAIVMDNKEIAPLAVNHTANIKAPITPNARLQHNPEVGGDSYLNELAWQPIEYIASYDVLHNGQKVANTRMTTWALTEPGEWQVIGIAADGTPSFASEPLSNRPAIVAQIPGESTVVASAEISYLPSQPIEGYRGKGFVETDMATAPVVVEVDVPEAGEYTVAYRYANGNGPVNTENKCAVRALFIDGEKVGTIVLPQRGVANWNDWGLTDSALVTLTPGRHTIALQYLPEDSNMNGLTNHALIDSLHLTRR